MRVSVIKNDKIQDIILQNFEGSYWITDTDSNGIERNLIAIETSEGRFKLVSNKTVYCVEKGLQQPYIYLDYGHFYSIRNEVEKENFLIYCSQILTSYDYYEIGSYLDKGIIIGSGSEALINYYLLGKNVCQIKFVNNRTFIIDNNSKESIYVNTAKIDKYKELKNGDVVFILGLKFMYLFIKDSYGNLVHYIGIDILNKNNVKVNAMASSLPAPKSGKFEDIDEDIEYALYDENEYFHKIPRFVKRVKKLELKIDPPPQKQANQSMPAILTMGPMLTMSLTTLMTFYTTIDRIKSGQATFNDSIPSLVMGGAMLTSVLLWPTITRKYEKHRKKVKEKERQQKYGVYIDSKKKEIIDAKKEQSEILSVNYPSIEKVVEVIAKSDLSMWQRRKKDEDYLEVRLGTGSYEMQIDINYPEDKFTMEEDNLKEMVSSLVKEPKLLENAPLVFSFVENYISGIIGEKTIIGEYTRRLLLQLLSFQSFDDLKIVILTDDENEYQWHFLRSIFHCFSDDKAVRFFATNNDEHKEVASYLDRILISRMEQFGESEINIEDIDQTYIIITDCFKKIRDIDFIKHLLDGKMYYGFSLFILDSRMTHLPDKCECFIQLKEDKGELYDSKEEGIIEFKPNLASEISYEDCAFKLANIPIEFENTVEGHIPSKLGFLEMYNVGKLEHLNIMNRWRLNDPTKSLRAPLGLDRQENIIYLDLHEKYHGPHGLIAGTTGSGKSEFIITYILSMAINYSPNEVAFILIDYKGGGLAGAFENKRNNVRLPHLAGTITNLDKNEMNRTLVSIQSELNRRQRKFNEARDFLGESTMDIYKYQRFFRERKLTEPMPHLFIICDEFAELKQQQPDFMDNLISAARIGRSLGVHLILATQKPSGVVNDQIWSNTKFRVCLKVAEKGDSNEIIKCPDAATITNAGRFYLQVGNNEIFILGQSGWCGTPYVPSEIVKKQYDRSVCFIDNIGNVIKKMEKKVKKEVVNDIGDELTNILAYVTELAAKLNLKAQNLWLDSIPSVINLNQIVNKYQYKISTVTAIIGEYDDPSNQFQNILTLPLDEEGNTICYGLSGNGREMFLRTLIYSVCENYSSLDVNFYIFDFGSETFRIFSKLPHVGDVIFSSETEKIDKMFKMLDDEIIERKKLFADYNGDYDNYCKYSGNKIPKMIIVFNNLEAFREMYQVYDELLITLSREGQRYGIIFIITTSTQSGLYGRFLKNYSHQFVLDMNSKDDYTSILGKIGNVYPADYQGRGLFRGELVYEFQTAQICEEDQIIEFIKEKSILLSNSNPKARSVPVLPDMITFDMLTDSLTSLKSVPIGIEKESLKTYNYNFKADNATIISANELESCQNITATLLNAFRKLGNVVSILFDMEEIFKDLKPLANSYCDKDYDNFIDEIIRYIDEKIINTDYNAVLLVAGIEKFNSNVDSKKITELQKKVKECSNCSFIFIDSNFKFKKLAFESWYLDLVSNSNGIWIGLGVAEQSVIKNSEFGKKFNVKISNDYAWVFKNGIGRLIKLINDKEKDK